MSIFCSEFENVWPKALTVVNYNDFAKELLNKCKDLKQPVSRDVNIESFQRKSADFPLKFGTNSCRMINQPKDRFPQIQKQIESAYPLIHERVLKLYLHFLEHKRYYGNNIEKIIYADMNITDFVQRLLKKRCASFFGKNDRYRLISGEEGYGGFENVGTETELSPLLLNNVLSYDEIKLSALMSVSSHSEFLNDGNRNNSGVIENNKTHIENEGIIIGLIGPRLTKRYVMEFQDIIIAKNQNVPSNGYGLTIDLKPNTKEESYRNVWKKFYEERDFLYEEIKKDGRRFDSTIKSNTDIFDNVIMKKRYSIAFDTLLLESEYRASKKNGGKYAYIHVVGIGLGVWKVAEHQEEIFLEAFNQRIHHLLPKLNHVGVIHFSWFHLTEWRELKHGKKIKSEIHPLGGITIYISKRNPADKLILPQSENMLLIVSYAWDGNALPGNEFWMEMLDATGDPAAACSSLISELHNPHINTDWVNGNNLHIASEMYGISHISKYAKKLLQ